MKIILKNFIHILKKFKTASILNILGLSAAFVVFIIAMLQVSYDLNYDTYFKKGNDIVMYNVYTVHTGENSCWTTTPNAKKLAEKAPQVEAYTIVQEWGEIGFTIDADRHIEEYRYRVSPGFIDLFEPTVLEGNMAEALVDPAKAAISESTAQKFFGTKHALGKTFNYYNSSAQLTVVAIIEDFPKNSSFKNGVYTYLPDDSKTESGYSAYYLVKEKNQTAFKDFLNSKDYLGQGYFDNVDKDPRRAITMDPIQFSSIHLHFPQKGEGDFAITMAMMAIAFLIIIIAFINYINFSIAMIPARVKALNIQNILGATKGMQKSVIVSESIIFSFIALAIALVGVHLIHTSPMQDFFSVDLSLTDNTTNLIVICFALLVVSILLGLYPAKYVTSFDAIDAIKGSSMTAINSTKLRNVLITVQFAAAISLIIIASFIKIQHDYMVNYSWGIQKENIIYFNRTDRNESVEALCEDLIKDPRILDYTTSRFAPGSVQMGWGRDFKNTEIYLMSWPVRENYLDFFGVKVIEGRNFSKESSNIEKILVNQKFLETYEFTSDIIGDSIFVFENNAEIIGIVEDINFETLKMPIRPMAFATIKGQKDNMIFLKITGEDIPGTLTFIKDRWSKGSKEAIDIIFLEERLDNIYKVENNLSKLVGIFSFITILIAVMGMYGLITFNSRYRAKEIAIRKVQGSTEKEIMLLLNKHMLIQFVVGLMLAIPIAYFTVQKWLEQFAYKTPVYWWVFALGAILILAITIITISIQSYRAASINPSTTLKNN